MYLNIHLIHNFPASNLNRDDTGAPKDTNFGGFRRARISSQCQKYAMRKHDVFKNEIKNAGGDFGIRTKRIIALLADKFKDLGKSEEESLKVAELVLGTIKVKKDGKNDEKSQVLLYIGEKELDEIVDVVLQDWENALKGSFKDPKAVINVIEERKAFAVDIALYGRMLAQKGGINMKINAACQVAHAISTHKSAVETDYFTAVDDLLPDDETGSDMIGVVEYNGACYYRYANIDLEKLKENLGETNADLLAATVVGFIKAMALALPTGMQNSFAAQTYPSYIEVVAMDKPLSYANAFSKPVRSSEKQSIEEASIEALQKYAEKIERFLGAEPFWRASIDIDSGSLPELVEKVRTHLKES